MRPYYLQNFSKIYFNRTATPNDIKDIFYDKYYFNIVAQKLTIIEYFYEKDKEALNKMKQLNKLLSTYLSK